MAACVDRELIIAAQSGSLESFETLIDKYEGKIFQFAFLMTNDMVAAEEILQEVFVQTYRQITAGALTDEDSLLSVLYQHAIAKLLADAADEVGENTALIDQVAKVAPLDQPLEVIETYSTLDPRQVLTSCVCSLPTDERQVFLLKDVAELDSSNVAQLISASLVQVADLANQARVRIAKSISGIVSKFRSTQLHAAKGNKNVRPTVGA